MQVIVLNYMRRGYTYAGELLNRHENMTYLFETIDGTYQYLNKSHRLTFLIGLFAILMLQKG